MRFIALLFVGLMLAAGAARAEDAPISMLDTGGHMAKIQDIAFTPDGQGPEDARPPEDGGRQPQLQPGWEVAAVGQWGSAWTMASPRLRHRQRPRDRHLSRP